MEFLKGIIKVFFSTLVGVVVVCQSVNAESDVEREELQRVLEEVHYVQKSLIIARNRVDETKKITFNYDALSNDLSLISQGISDYLNEARREPRLLPPIDGEYRHAR